MLYSEFIEGTGCRDNDHNYQLYKRLEIIYMNDDTVSKQDIYEMGKKLANNQDTPEQKTFKEQLRKEIAQRKETIRAYKEDIKFQRYMIPGSDKQEQKERRRQIKCYQELIRDERKQIYGLEWVLG